MKPELPVKGEFEFFLRGKIYFITFFPINNGRVFNGIIVMLRPFNGNRAYKTFAKNIYIIIINDNVTVNGFQGL